MPGSKLPASSHRVLPNPGLAAGAAAKSAAFDRALEPEKPLVIQIVVAEKDWPRYVETVVAHFAPPADSAAQRDAQRDQKARELDRKRVPESRSESAVESSSLTVEQPRGERWFRLRTDNPQRLANELTELIPDVQVAVSQIEAPRSVADSSPMEAMKQTFLPRGRESRKSQDESVERVAGKQPAEFVKASSAAGVESVILVIRAGVIPAEVAPSARP